MRHYSVAAQSESVHPRFQPMSHSTNSGFNFLIEGEDFSPEIEVVSGWRESGKARIASVNESPSCMIPVVVVFRAALFPSLVFGEGHSCAAIASGVPHPFPL